MVIISGGAGGDCHWNGVEMELLEHASALFLGLLVVIGCINCLLLHNTLAER